MSKLILHGFYGSPFARTVGMLLIEKGVDFDHNKVNVLAGETRQPEHLVRNAFGRVPVLEHDGLMIYETSAILDYIEAVFPGPSFTPSDAKDKARMDMAIAAANNYGSPTLVFSVSGYHLFPDFVGGKNEETRQNGITGGNLFLKEMMRLRGNSAYIAGDTPTLADLFVVPQVTYLAATPDADATWGDIPGVQEWFANMKQLKSYNPTDPTQNDPTA